MENTSLLCPHCKKPINITELLEEFGYVQKGKGYEKIKTGLKKMEKFIP